MPEETTQTPPVEETVESAKSETSAILDEFGKLGNKIAAAFQTAWDSEERKKTEDEIRKALHTAGDRIDEIAVDLRKSEVTKDPAGSAKDFGLAKRRDSSPSLRMTPAGKFKSPG